MTQRHFFSTLHPLSTVIFATTTVLAFVLLRNSRSNFHCYTQREAMPTQKLARKCAATSRDCLCKRLQSAFTLANQLCWIAQWKMDEKQSHMFAVTELGLMLSIQDGWQTEPYNVLRPGHICSVPDEISDTVMVSVTVWGSVLCFTFKETWGGLLGGWFWTHHLWVDH